MSERIGQQLRQAREARSLTLEQVARATHMRLNYLSALETGELDALPSYTQARGFLRAYASYLELDADEFLRTLDDELQESPAEQPPAEQPTPPQPTPETLQAEAIFIELGGRLKRQRQLLGLSLEEVEQYTRIRLHYLQAIEAGQIDLLPSPVQGRGMLENYANFLGMDPEPLMLRFAEGLQARLAARQAATAQAIRPKRARQKAARPSRVRRLLSNELLIVGTLGLVLVGFILWGAIRIFSMTSNAQPTETAPSIAEVLLATPTETQVPTPEPVTPTVPQPPLPASVLPTQPTGTVEIPFLPTGDQVLVSVYLTLRERAWLRVLVDGEVEFEGRALPGSAYAFTGQEQIEVLTGNGAAVLVFFNQQDLGALGLPGQVVNRIFTPQGIIAPTATITPTPSATPRVTPTPPNLPGAGTAPPPAP